MSNIWDLFKQTESKAQAPMGKIGYVIAGLGNPGKEYAGTRHNAGFRFIDYVATELGVRVDRAKFNGLYADTEVGGTRVLLVTPMTMMNASGVCLREFLSFYKIPPENLIVVYDDVNLDPGELRIRKKGSDGGHNGLKSIIYQIQSDNFPRIRIGVGKKPHPEYVLADWVLGTPDAAAKKAEAESDIKAYDALKLMVAGKTDDAMNRFNAKKKG
ncbi:MAG: aminoacyl-tRNA hydrolase [Ruminococcaceae bacterium]|nr:aminoacyl-tRNA hydrolase [Oscillospiraceae bacterium]